MRKTKRVPDLDDLVQHRFLSTLHTPRSETACFESFLRIQSCDVGLDLESVLVMLPLRP